MYTLFLICHESALTVRIGKLFIFIHSRPNLKMTGPDIGLIYVLNNIIPNNALRQEKLKIED